MIDPERAPAAAAADTSSDTSATSSPQPAATERPQVDASGNRLWWLKLFIQPALLLAAGSALLISLGVAQRFGLISANHPGGSDSGGSTNEASVRYICPMMCTPPQSEPGRCPVCAMELVPASSGGGESDTRAVHIDPAARRVANIHTVAAVSMPMTRTIRAVGEFSYDEGTLKTLSAYVSGRLERLYADYTGVVVSKGDHLALIYSPKLYSSQVEFLLARQAHEESQKATRNRVSQSSRELYESARQRLIELGMTASQIDQLAASGEANSRLHLRAPISGTVIEKMAVEGQYVQEGQEIYRLADLSSIWLMLELFPEDASTIRYGQKVDAQVQSLPGQRLAGRVAFIDPNVDPQTRTVGVRVVVPNPHDRLRVGDYVKATLEVPVPGTSNSEDGIYDPELANKWISPRHPHIVQASPGTCPICGVELVPAAELGFTAEATASTNALVVPRDAVLMAGDHSVLYVETDPGRFEIRRVVLGPSSSERVAVLKGLEEGERVATRGNFLIDSQMQLVGNPSLIDPTRAAPDTKDGPSEEMLAAMSELLEVDRELVLAQRFCPVADIALGSMGPPLKVDVEGTTVFICCEGCRASLLEKPDEFIAKLADARADERPANDASMDLMELPPIGVPESIEPDIDVPPIEPPQRIVPKQAHAPEPPLKDSKLESVRPQGVEQ